MSNALVRVPGCGTVVNRASRITPRVCAKQSERFSCGKFCGAPVVARPTVSKRSFSQTLRATASDDFIEVPGDFSIAQVSFGTILAPIGIGLLVYGFGGYFNILPGGDISSILLIYGFPLMLLGLALKYAELKPVECRTTQAALELRETQMTDIQKQVREDVTRFRYGDEQHLEEALERIFMLGRGGGLPRRLCPKLTGIREETRDNMYTLVLEFASQMTDEQWQQRLPKFQSFFGPGIVAEITAKESEAEVALVCDGSGDGRTGKEKKDVLPPLVPGLAPRQQD